MSEKHDLQDEVVEFNRNYLSFANRLIREDRENAKQLLGLSDEVASMIGNLTPGQIKALAASKKVVCGLRAEEAGVLFG
ncbi:flagellar transcriptional regulator FlhD [Caballeronia zhejiangensis]|uniref:flagellar transcriptional regulator FlhD n=1 Tax=Caballeronia zhejiangensis TaxID=871203 RepID=UPI001F52385F|nr:flagellar transcriptional regulator FlhD [Caballeronia zhejiangensis]MCI1047011.1 flagellar transcriptional regulator FlhD [Caballeronia zhejiangensis]